MPVNNLMTAEQIAELKRLWEYATREHGDGTKHLTHSHTVAREFAHGMFDAFPALIAALEAAEARIDELEAEVEELESNSIEYEKDCTKALCSLAREFDYEWDGDGATADDLREFIATTVEEAVAQRERFDREAAELRQKAGE